MDENDEVGPIYRQGGHYRQDICVGITHEWDEKGKYLGQWRPNMRDYDGTSEIFLPPVQACRVPDLTTDQMAVAEDPTASWEDKDDSFWADFFIDAVVLALLLT